MVGILKALNADASAENNTRAFSVLIAFSGGVWCASPRYYSVMRLRVSLTLFQLFVPFLGSSSKSADLVSPFLRGRLS
jgi:hypothetical protein